MNKRHLRVLEAAFSKEIERAMAGNSLPIWLGRSKAIQECVDAGFLEPRTDTIPSRFGPITIAGYELTHLGRALYCESCRDTPEPTE